MKEKTADMEEIKIDGIPIEDYGTPNSRSVYCGEINVGQTIKSNIDFWKEKYFELEKNSIPISLIEKKIEELREKVDGNDYWKYTEKDYLGMQYQIEVLLELLDERNNTDEY